MPVHALKGLKLDLVRTQRDHLARRQTLIAEVPGGGRIVLPIEWTDRGPPWTTPTVDGTEVRLSARGLLALALAVDTALRQNLAICLRPVLPRWRLNTRAGAPMSRPTSTPVQWVELTPTTQRDLLGAWASLLRNFTVTGPQSQ